MTHSRIPLTTALALGFCFAALGAGPQTAAAAGPVKVFILAGQSNMEGKALASTLEPVIADAETHERFKHLRRDGKWTVREDVWVTFLDKRVRGQSDLPLYGPLTVGFGAQKQARDDNNKRVTVPSIGPELGIGHVLGDHFEEQVLLIKAAWGGRAVKYSFRPPSAMPSDDVIRAQVEAIAEKREAAIKRAEAAKAAGKRVKRPPPERSFEDHKAGYGSGYRAILAETKKVLDDIKTYFPDYDPKQGYEIAGFIWFQGWNDAIGKGNPDYVHQMAHFIRDIRKDLKTPKMPFVIGELGTDGPDAKGWIPRFRAQQAEIAAMTEFRGTVRLARTARFWPTKPDLEDEWREFRTNAKRNEEKAESDPTRMSPRDFYQKFWVRRYKKELSYTSDKRYHYKGSGACYYQMGEAMGKAMLELVE